MQREREAETQAEGEADSMQGARHGTRSQVSRIMPWAEWGVNAEPPGLPDILFFIAKSAARATASTSSPSPDLDSITW